MRKHQQVRRTGRESQRTIRRLLTLYQRQINHQQGQITDLENHIGAQELRVRLLQGIRRVSTSTLELGSLFPVLLEMVLDAVAADHGSLLLINPDEKRVLFGIQGAKNGSAMPLGNVSLKQGYRRQIFTGGRTTLLKTLTAPPPGWEMPRFKGGRASLLVIPLQISGRMIGLLELLRPPSAPPFHPQDAELLTTVGHQLGMVMENARLYSEASKQVGQFSTLMELSAILNSTLQFSEVLRRTVEAATRLMECEVGSLLLLNEDGDELVFEVALGERGREVKDVRLKVGEGIAGWVVKTGKPAVVNSVERDARFLRRVDVRTHFTTQNMICVPLKSRNRIIGVLQAINRLSARPFTVEDQRLFESLARQVGIAIENSRLYEEVKTTFFGTVATLAEAIEKRDPYTGGHVRRVVEVSLILGEELGLSVEEMETIHLSAILHDVGKIGIRDGVLQKHGPLSPEEMAHIREHPEIGAEILAHIKQLEAVIPAVRYHQERCDGLGYPEGLKGEEIPLASRVIAVADTFDAITTDRPYRPRLSDEAAANEIERGAGTQFDLDVVEAFLRAYRQGRISSAALWALEKGAGEQRGIMSVQRVSEGIP